MTRLRKMVVFDRLLARLLVVAPDRWIVKGGIALDLRLGNRARITKDLDLARQDTESAATADLNAATETDLDDFFTFAIARTDALEADEDGTVVRFSIEAQLASRRFETVVLDIGFGDPLPDAPERISGSGILSFAGVPPIQIPALPLELHLAEKVHAYTRSYGGGRLSSRVKDIVDIVVIGSAATFEGERLRQALDHVFAVRATHGLPTFLPPPPPSWDTAYRKLASGIGLDPSLRRGYGAAASLLSPVLSGEIPGGFRWDPTARSWSVPMTSQ